MIGSGILFSGGLLRGTADGFAFAVMSGQVARILGRTGIQQFILSAHAIILLTFCIFGYAVGAEAEPRAFSSV